MLPRVLNAYKKLGYSVDMGSPAKLFSSLIEDKHKRTVYCSGGFTVSDAFVFLSIGRLIKPKNILVIGNSFGLSTFVLSEIFPEAEVDAIDAELEDVEPQRGSEITRHIIASDFPKVKLTKGFSPDDLDIVANGKKYGFIFVDAMHNNEAVLKDYYGILPMLEDNCIIYFHDVANCNMFESWEKIKNDATKLGLKSFELGFTQMGCTAITKGYTDVEKYLSLVENNFHGPYKNGYTSSDVIMLEKKPFYWDLTLRQLQVLIKKRIKKIFGLNKISSNYILNFV